MLENKLSTLDMVSPHTNRVTHVDIDFLEGLDNGAEGKTRVFGKIDSKKAIRLVIKRVSLTTHDSDCYINIWRCLKEASLPVVPTVRKVNEHDIAMTDLCSDGSEFYGKSRNWYPETHTWLLVDVFNRLNFRDVRNCANTIANHATKNGIGLPGDDPLELLIHPDGSWNLIILDIADTLFTASSKNLKKHNQNRVRDFIDFLDATKKGNRYYFKRR